MENSSVCYVFVEIGNLKRRQINDIDKERELTPLLLIIELVAEAASENHENLLRHLIHLYFKFFFARTMKNDSC
jgi:hypothetical protein